MRTRAQKPYIYGVTIQCREMQCDGGTEFPSRHIGDSAHAATTFRQCARLHAARTGHEVELLIETVHAYERAR